MLATSKGALVTLSTPFGKRGWFHEEWTGTGKWERVKVRPDECPRITPAFLAEERAALGPRWYAQEYEVSFESTVAAVFLSQDIDAAARDDIEELDLGFRS
jgi:hypothetical protein